MTLGAADLRLAVDIAERASPRAAALASSDPFEVEPVPIDRWMLEPRYVQLGFEPSPLQWAFLRHMEWVYKPADWVDLGWVREDVRLINLAVLKWGKGSGKDTLSQVALLRIAYLLQCLKNPQAYYGLGLHSTIHMTNIAVNSTQANSVFYTPLKALIQASPYWRDKADVGAGKTEFAKQVELLSGHSDVGAQEGMNLLAGVADEIAEFKTKQELEATARGLGSGVREPKNSAEGIDNLLRSSGRSRFPDVFKVAFLSWTRFRGDYIEKVYEEGEKSQRARGRRSRWFISHAATWVANPSKRREDFNEDYEKDPEEAAGRYECVPPRAKARYLRNLVALARSFPEKDWRPVTYELEEGEDPDNPGHYGWQAVFTFDPEFVPARGAAYAVHIDLAHTGDRAGFAMSHVSARVSRERGEGDERRAVMQEQVDLDVAIGFEQGPHGEIELRWPRQLVYRLVERGFRVVIATLDGWQSVDSIQTLNAALGNSNPKAPAAERKVAELYSLDRNTEGYDTLKSLVYGGLYRGWRTPDGLEVPGQTLDGPEGHECIWWAELRSLQKTGGAARFAKVDHPPYGSKDVSDAVAGSARGALRAYDLFGGGDLSDIWAGGGSPDAASMLDDPAVSAGWGADDWGDEAAPLMPAGF